MVGKSIISPERIVIVPVVAVVESYITPKTPAVVEVVRKPSNVTCCSVVSPKAWEATVVAVAVTQPPSVILIAVFVVDVVTTEIIPRDRASQMFSVEPVGAPKPTLIPTVADAAVYVKIP